jgi:fatty acid desaturase
VQNATRVASSLESASGDLDQAFYQPSVRSLFVRPAVAWPTLALAATALALWFAALALAWTERWPLPVAGLLAALSTYLAFMSLHEAVHGNVSRFSWLNGLIGRLSALPLHAPFHGFRTIHVAHHRFVNETERDPDMWGVSARRWVLPLRWVTQDFYYYSQLPRLIRRRAEKIEVAITVLLTALLFAWLVRHGHGHQLLWGWLLPTRLAIFALSAMLGYFPHVPHHLPADVGRFRSTRVVESAPLAVLLCGQNYHLIHHLYPAVPFYRYAPLYQAQRAYLQANGAQIPGAPGATPA